MVWNEINNIINVKFWNFSYILGTSRSHSMLAVRYTTGNVWADSLRSLTLYIAQRRKVIGLTRLVTTYVPSTLRFALLMETALGSIFRRSYHYVFEIYLASNYIR